MKIYIYLLLILAAALGGCDTLVTEIAPKDLPNTSSKLVVQSFISPQAATIYAVVTESVPLFGESGSANGVIKDAVVIISGGGREAVLPYDTASQLYSIERAKFPINPSQTYKLSVSDGKRSVFATCTVPAGQVTIRSYRIDTAYITRRSGRPDTALTISAVWQDIPGEKNFYRVRASMDIEYSILEGTGPEDFQEKRVRVRSSFNWDDDSGRSEFQNDVNLDGTLFTSPTGRSFLPPTLLYTSADGVRYYARQKPRLLAVVIEVNNAEESYYTYHKSLDLNDQSDNPFSEPALVYNNINGGLGCFAAYNNRQIIYRPK